DLNKALINNYHETIFANDRIQYKKTDSVVKGVSYNNILVYSTNPDSTTYQAGFSFVGENRGNYRTISSSANGQVYEWVAPVDGTPQGSYEPITRLITPQSKQLMSLGTKIDVSERMKVSAELALSNNDLNTFSKLDKDDNAGSGVQARIDRYDPLGPDSAWTVSSFVSFRRSGKNFNPLEKFRSVEFERDWNLKDDINTLTENYFKTGIRLNNRDSLSAQYSFDHLSYSQSFKASRHNSSGLLYQKGMALHWTASYLDSKDNFRATHFTRHRISLSKNWKKISLSLTENHEGNRWVANDSANLQVGSFAFQEWQIEVHNIHSATVPWFVKITNRNDFLPDNETLVLDNRAWQTETGFNWIGKKNQITRLSANFRKLNNFGHKEINTEEQNLTARAEEKFQLLKGGITSRSFYEIGSGLERKQEFSYLEVQAGQGYYSWTDYNGNGIKELDEFEAAVFADQANFIRIFRPGTDYVPVYSNRFTQTINVTPARMISKNSSWYNMISAFSNRFAMSINRKTFRNDLVRYLNPFIINDSLQLSLQAQIRNTLSFNTKNNRFGIDYFFQQADNQNLMTYGSDQRSNTSHSLIIRLKPLDQLWINNKTEQANRSYNSSFFTSRNYQLHIWQNKANITIEPSDITRVNIQWNWSNEKNLTGIETLVQNRIELGGDIQMPRKGLIHLDLQYINLNYPGNPNTPVAYAMLKGFRPGNNGMANLSIRRQLNELIQLDLVYSGRLSEGSNIIHTGSISVRAVF
ncbi:MAG: hypothetical protein J7L96_02515, partial [Bacteroidales bacterium]|nr:hypothetical protein [Bacteroidales bacterium]